MSQFRFEKHQVAARLSLATGSTIDGSFFVATSLTTHGGPERVGDLLNAEDGFFPFQNHDGTTGQYNRAHVVTVTLQSGVAEEELEPGHAVALRRAVTMTLSTGASIEGTVFVSGAAGYERLSDYVRNAKHFWYVATVDGTTIVNANHIVEIIEKAAP